MKKIFTKKISLQSSNPTYSYPIIRLPRTLKDLAGETVTIYQTERDGSLAFFVVPKLDNLGKFMGATGEEDQELNNALIDQKLQKPNGLGRIRTGDLRHVKTEDLAVFEAFSVGDITVRKANDPLYIV
ncbi:MAG: hypothetical protein ACXWEM_04740 [Halobacteriota archaeon]